MSERVVSVAATQMACSWDREANVANAEVLVHRFDLEAIRGHRASFGFFRDRRTELYESLLTLDGRTGRGR